MVRRVRVSPNVPPMRVWILRPQQKRHAQLNERVRVVEPERAQALHVLSHQMGVALAHLRGTTLPLNGVGVSRVSSLDAPAIDAMVLWTASARRRRGNRRHKDHSLDARAQTATPKFSLINKCSCGNNSGSKASSPQLFNVKTTCVIR